MTVVRMASLVGACVVLSGCTSDFAHRYGSDPVPTREEFEDRAKLQKEVMGALASSTFPDGHTPTSSDEWYAVTLTGYNVVDLGCDEYLRTIFKFDREKDRFAASMVFADKATGAILSASNAAPATVQVVSQAFGLGSTFGNAIAETYLFKLRPAAIAGVVQKMRATFRESVDAGMRATPPAGGWKPIRSSETAFQSIHEYRSLCYPETIEAKVEDMLASSSGTVKEAATAPATKTGQTAKTGQTTSTSVAPATTAAPQIGLETKK